MAWFYLGMVFEINREFIVQKMKKSQLYIFISAFILITAFKFYCNYYFEKMDSSLFQQAYKLFDKGLALILIFLGIIISFGLCFKFFYFEQLNSLSKTSFDIYLFAVPFSNLWVKLIQMIIPVNKMSNIIYLLSLVLKIVIGIIFAFLISILKNYMIEKYTKLQKKNKLCL